MVLSVFDLVHWVVAPKTNSNTCSELDRAFILTALAVYEQYGSVLSGGGVWWMQEQLATGTIASAYTAYGQSSTAMGRNFTRKQSWTGR